MLEPMATRAQVQLVRHPRSVGAAAHGVEVVVQRRDETLQLEYRVHGNMERLDVPRAPLDHERLWERTCAELFVLGSGGAYVEWNFSPTGQSTRFGFSGYRDRVRVEATQVVPHLRRDPDVVELSVRGSFAASPSRLGLSMVTRDVDGRYAYWALHHPGDEPDFHHPGGFTLELG